jgi:hypothetical protein
MLRFINYNRSSTIQSFSCISPEIEIKSNPIVCLLILATLVCDIVPKIPSLFKVFVTWKQQGRVQIILESFLVELKAV